MLSRQLRDKIYRLSMSSYAVITIFMGGFGWFWLESGAFEQRPTSGPFIVMAVSTLAYLGIRMLLFRNRQTLKLLRKKIAKSRK